MKQLYSLLSWIFISSYCFANDKIPFQDSTFFFTSNLSPKQINLSIQRSQFSVQKDRRFNFGLTTNEYCYIVLKVQGNTQKSYSLSIDNTSLDTVFIYNLQPDGTKQLLYQGGNLIRYNTKRPYVWHTIDLTIEEKPVYYLLAVKSLSQNVNVAYKIMQPDELQSLYRSFDRLIYFYSGLILLISLISLLGYLVFKRKALIIYTGYVLAVAAWILAHYGYLFPLLFPSFPVLNGIVKQVASLAAILCLLNLITSSFKNELQKKWIVRTLLSLKIVTGLLIILFFIHLIGSFRSYDLTIINVVWHLSILFSICAISVALAFLFKSSKTAKIFSVAISLMLLAAFFQIVSNAGWVYSQFLNDHGMLIASVLEMLVLTVGIFYSLWEEKARKEEELKIAEQERSKALQMLIGVQDEERKRIAEDLHDSIGPMLAAIKINFSRMAKAKAEGAISENLAFKTENIIDESIAEIRNISHQLMPKGLSSKGLITLLSDYFANLEAVYAISIHFRHTINIALEKDVQLNLYRMISELSLNAAKHSEAKTLEVSINTLSDETLIIVKDDGKGFTGAQKDPSSLGIKNIKSRVNYLKGRMQLESLAGKGTTIEIFISQKQ